MPGTRLVLTLSPQVGNSPPPAKDLPGSVRKNALPRCYRDRLRLHIPVRLGRKALLFDSGIDLSWRRA